MRKRIWEWLMWTQDSAEVAEFRDGIAILKRAPEQTIEAGTALFIEHVSAPGGVTIPLGTRITWTCLTRFGRLVTRISNWWKSPFGNHGWTWGEWVRYNILLLGASLCLVIVAGAIFLLACWWGLHP